MPVIRRHAAASVVELGSSYAPLDPLAIAECGDLLLEEASSAEPPYLILDFSQTTFIGSSFIELLVRVWKRLRQRGGTMVLCEVQPFCVDVLHAAHLDTLWPLFATRDDALQAIGRAGRE